MRSKLNGSDKVNRGSVDGWKADEKEIFSEGKTSELFIRISTYYDRPPSLIIRLWVDSHGFFYPFFLLLLFIFEIINTIGLVLFINFKSFDCQTS